MTNKSAVSDNYIVRKIIQALYPKGTVPTAEELLEKVDQMALENRRNNQLDSVKSVRGWKQVEMCCECGTTSTLEEIASNNPKALSCCPERRMIPTLVPAGYGNVAEAATRNFVQSVGDILRCPSTLNDYPQILSALHDVIDNSNKKSAELRKSSEALEGIKNIIWGRDARPHVDDLVESVAGLKMSNTDFLEQRAELEKERDGFKRTLDLVNEELDSVALMVGATDLYDIRQRVEGMLDRCKVVDEAERAGLVRKAVFLPTDLHLQTADLITSFAESLGQRLVYKQRAGYNGWDGNHWRDECLRSLHTSDKPLDVAAFAVFAWYHDWAGSYAGLVGETSVVHNHTISINVGGDVNGADLSEIIRQHLTGHRQHDEPTGFRTEPKKPVEVDFTGVECLIPRSDGQIYMRKQDVEHAVRQAGAVVKLIEADPEGFRTEPAADLCRRIANTGAVDDALRELVSDSTEENGVLVVGAVYNALQREGKIR